jgi:cupin fold WbuC family metalloprotein
MKKITNTELNKLSLEAKNSERKRKNFNFHYSYADPLNRMLNALEPGTYVHPHKHEDPDKREAFIILRGRIVVVIFDNQGNIKDSLILDPEKGNYGVEIPEKVWHTLISLEKGSVIYEVKDGPYSPLDDKNFAPWAPKEGSPECANYLNQILNSLNID